MTLLKFSCGPRSAHIHFILKRKLKFFLQRGRQVCRPAGSGQHITKSLDQLKVCCRFSPHTLHLGKKVEVFPAEGGEVLQVQRYDRRDKEKKNPIDPGKALGSADLSLSKMA